METETALCGSASSFIFEKVLQEVKEVENREHRDDDSESPVEDLKFRPGFVHLLKDRFALLSVKSNVDNNEDGRVRSGSAHDLLDHHELRDTQHISRSIDNLDTPSFRGSHLETQDKQSGRLNGSVVPGNTVSSTAYVKLQSKEEPRESTNEKAPTKPHPSSIHLFPKSTDTKTVNRIRNAGNKVIIIESTTKKKQSGSKKERVPPPKDSTDSKDLTVVPGEFDPGEAWPVPNIVKSTRTLFEQNRNKRPAPSIPSETNESLNNSATSKTLKSSLPTTTTRDSKSNSSVSSSSPTTQILVHGQPLKILQAQSSRASLSNAEKVDKQSKIDESSLRKSAPSIQTDNLSVARKTTTKSTPKTVFLPSSQVESIRNANKPPDTGADVKEEAVVSVSEAKLLFDKFKDSQVDMKENKQKPDSPKKSKTLVFSASDKVDGPPRRSYGKTTAPQPRTFESKSSPSTALSLKQVMEPNTSAPSHKASVNVPIQNSRTVSSYPSKSSVPRHDPNTWQSWDDIPKPQRRTFVSEARRVDISQEQLSASRAKNKSFLFTASEPSNKSLKLDDEPTLDRTVKITVPKVSEEKSVFSSEPEKMASESRLAQQTFWDSYRNEEEGKEANVDSELYGDFLKLMASTKSSSVNDAQEDSEASSLPATNIDDILGEPVNVNGVDPKGSGIRVVDRTKRKSKPKLSFAKDACLTSTYEYPSERTMIEQLGISPDFDLDGGVELSIADPSALFGLDDATNEDQLKNKLLSGKPAVNSGTLATYQPKFGSDYTWGQQDTPSKSQSSSQVTRELLGGAGDVETSNGKDTFATQEDDMNWSSAATSDLLF